jgi:hypothetical protein
MQLGDIGELTGLAVASNERQDLAGTCPARTTADWQPDSNAEASSSVGSRVRQVPHARTNGTAPDRPFTGTGFRSVAAHSEQLSCELKIAADILEQPVVERFLTHADRI